MKPGILHALAAAAAVACFLPGCEGGTGSTTESGVVAGRLLAPGGAPLRGARVSLLPVDHVPSPALRKAAAAEAVTDEDGRYRLAGIAPGTYALTGARDSLAYYRDSLRVPAAGLEAGPVTALPAGSLHGRVRLEAGDEVRTVLILVLGTNTLAVPRDTGGAFDLAALAEGTYRVRFLSTLSAYAPLDTVLSIRSGRSDTLAEPIRLRSGGIPAVTGLTARWDADAQAVDLAWEPADPARAKGYNVYRALEGELMGSLPLNPVPLAAASWRDTTAQAGKRYVYAVKAVDGNGNVGAAFSPPAAVAADPAYFMARSIVPTGYTEDPSPLAVSKGEIFWLRPDGVDVYDTTGRLVRTFGNTGPDSLIRAVAIRVFGDTVYVVDKPGGPGMDPMKNDHAIIRRYSRAGVQAPSLAMPAMPAGLPVPSWDLHKGPDGTLYATNGYFIFSLDGNGVIDSVESPLDPELRNLFAKLEPAAGGMLVMGSLGNLTTGISRTQSAVVDYGLRAGPVDSLPVFLNAYAGEASGALWIVRDDSLAEYRSTSGKVERRLRLPKSLYRDIQEEGNALYLFDYETQAIRIWRRN